MELIEHTENHYQALAAKSGPLNLGCLQNPRSELRENFFRKPETVRVEQDFRF